MPFRSPVAAALCIGLAACARTENIQAFAPVPFQCPDVGFKAYYNGAPNPVAALGPDPATPTVCRATNPNGAIARRVVGIDFFDAKAEPEAIAGLAGFFPLQPGKTARFSYMQSYTNDRTKFDPRNETWTVAGPETITLLDKPHPTIKIVREIENPQTYGSAAVRWDLWYSPTLHMIVRGERTVQRGTYAPAYPFTLTRIIPAKPAA